MTRRDLKRGRSLPTTRISQQGYGEHRNHGWWACVEHRDLHRRQLSRESTQRRQQPGRSGQEKHHSKALEVYQAAYNKYSCERTQLLDWIATNAQILVQAKQNLANTDFAFKLYNQVHPDKPIFPVKDQSSPISFNRVSSRKKVS